MARVYKDPRLFRSTGKVVWCIDFVGLDGERHREKTAASSKELAQQLLRKKLDDIEKAKIHGLVSIKPISFDAFAPEYLAHVDAVRSESSQVRVRSFVKLLRAAFGSKFLGRISTGDVQRWVDMSSG